MSVGPLPPLLLKGDCVEELRRIPDESVDAVVTDPPYGLDFMGRDWDNAAKLAGGMLGQLATGDEKRGAFAFELWTMSWAVECLRILKPGGHLLAFGGSRTWHRLAAGIEDAGFEIRDSLAWLYGSGMPKSLDVSKAIDKLDAAAVRLERARTFQAAPAAEKKDVPHTPEAEAWQGWGTALKPAFEPIVVARKPLPYRRTVAANVLEHGTGALNIDATRLPVEDAAYAANHSGDRGHAGTRKGERSTNITTGGGSANDGGRWPTNAILDEESAAWLDAQTGTTKSRKGRRNAPKAAGIYGAYAGDDSPRFGHEDEGGASRFFYVAKAPKSERPVVDGVAHPTVKPLALMRRLCRLVTPPGGVVVDPFAGSGTTLEAAYLEDFEAIGVEKTPEYWPLVAARIERVTR